MRLALVLSALLVLAPLASSPAEAGVRLLHLGKGKHGHFHRHDGRDRDLDLRFDRHFRFFRRPLAFTNPTGFLIPRRRLAQPSPFEQVIRFPVAEWSYRRFRRHSDFEQKSTLWQTHLRPSPGYPNQ